MESKGSHKNLIIIPYAEIQNFKSGVSIKNEKQRKITYLKNMCVAAISAKHNAGNAEVAIVTNIELPSDYALLLVKHGVLLIKCPFNNFNFGPKYRWSLAFYKLCALKFVVDNLDYTNFCYVDSDIFIQSNIDSLWENCRSHILMYRFELYANGKSSLQSEYENLTGDNEVIFHYGGEFFAASKSNSSLYLDQCQEVFRLMQKQSFHTSHGDEFISSIACARLEGLIKHAGDYVHRFWTRRHRVIPKKYKDSANPVGILHVPSEKEYGMIKLFDYYMEKGTMPSIKRVHKVLHLDRPSFIIGVYLAIKKICPWLK